MSTKIIYFVRHGETILNAKNVRQGSEGLLSDKGRLQAEQTAKRFPRHHGRAEIMIVSPFERTRETAGIINERLHLPIEYCDLLKERRNPTEIIGHSMSEPETQRIVDMMDNSYHGDDYRFSDEENFTDLKTRAHELLEFIKQRKEHRIIMVTHKIFLKMVIAYILYGESLDASTYNTLSFYNPMDNAGITVASYTKGLFSKGTWKILAWNDQTEVED